MRNPANWQTNKQEEDMSSWVEGIILVSTCRTNETGFISALWGSSITALRDFCNVVECWTQSHHQHKIWPSSLICTRWSYRPEGAPGHICWVSSYRWSVALCAKSEWILREDVRYCYLKKTISLRTYNNHFLKNNNKALVYERYWQGKRLFQASTEHKWDMLINEFLLFCHWMIISDIIRLWLPGMSANVWETSEKYWSFILFCLMLVNAGAMKVWMLTYASHARTLTSTVASWSWYHHRHHWYPQTENNYVKCCTCIRDIRRITCIFYNFALQVSWKSPPPADRKQTGM